MEDILRGILSTLAEYSSVCSICVIVISCTYMVVFIMRLSTDHFTPRSEAQPGSYIPAQVMRDVHNPFLFKLQDSKKSTFKDGAWFELTSHVPCEVQVFWGVDIQKIYPAIFQPWHLFLKQFNDEHLFKDFTKFKESKIIIEEDCEKKSFYFNTPVIGSDLLDLGEPPRSSYPLVVVIVNTLGHSLLEDLSIMCMVSIVHISDEVCTGKSHILSQYVRTFHGQPYCLQQLYVAASEQETPPTGPPSGSSVPSVPRPKPSGDSLHLSNTSEADEGNCSPDGCIICQVQTITRAFLPCRHACVCDDCFIRLDRCPMCRSGIESYFHLDGQSEEWTLGNDDAEEDWWQRFNRTLNESLGNLFHVT